MADKQLTAKVRLNTTQFEQKLKRIAKGIDALNNSVNKQSSAYDAVNRALKTNEQTTKRIKTATDKVKASTSGVNNATKTWKNSLREVNNYLKSSNSSLGSIGNKIRTLVGAYIGLQGLQLGVTTSDTITSAQNRLNNIEGGNPQLTAESMDKMYAASQRARTGYAGMLGNVSKTMTLAGDSFQNNIDNAIRFQEIMAKAYTVGGASAEEQATSMYQLVQALGSGILQGDELRSVREGAPIAYKAIEEFAQGVFKTEDSLKDLASQGLITSDIIVGAIMDAEKKINKSFENTQMTFAQAWDKIKNMATKAFEPVSNKLNEILNSEKGQKAIESLGKVFVWLANATLFLIDVFGKFFNWFAENWYWIKHVIVGVLIAIITYTIIKAGISVACAIQEIIAFAMVNTTLFAILLTIAVIIAAILAMLYVFLLWKQGAIDTIQAIVYGLLILAAVAWLLGFSWIAIFLAVFALILMYFAEFCGYVNVGLQAIVNAWFWCGNLIHGVWNWLMTALGNAISWLGNLWQAVSGFIVTVWHNRIADIVNISMGLWNVIQAVAQNIGIAFSNAWNGALSAFWNFIASCVEGLDWLAKPLKSIAELFGKSFNYESFSAGIRGKADSYASKQQDFVSVSDAWNAGINTRSYESSIDAWNEGWNTYDYENLGDAWSSGWNTYDVFQDGWASDAYDTGFEWGQGIENKINEWGSKWQNTDSDKGWLSGLDKLMNGENNLGDTLDNLINGSGLPDPNDPKYGLGGAYDPAAMDDDIKNALDKLNDGVDDISGNTGDIKDSLELADDDLEFLRKIAEMEWRNEFTTAEIKVDMTNNNTVNGERDLDGIVEYLSDVLRAEMTNVAYGVHY